MKERPILFSGPMVRAILEGHKTQTRRVMKQQPKRVDAVYADGTIDTECLFRDGRRIKCPYGTVGDRLWVRETWQGPLIEEGQCLDNMYAAEFCEYAATQKFAPEFEDADGNQRQGWRPSIHMPRWASRLLLEITDVRVERVQDISEADALAEGIEGPFEVGHTAYRAPGDSKPRYSKAAASFESLWDSINAKRGFGWDANPWVWALTFKRVEVVR